MQTHHVQDISAILSMHEMTVMRYEVFPTGQLLLLHSVHILSICISQPILPATDLTHPTPQISKKYIWNYFE